MVQVSGNDTTYGRTGIELLQAFTTIEARNKVNGADARALPATDRSAIRHMHVKEVVGESLDDTLVGERLTCAYLDNIDTNDVVFVSYDDDDKAAEMFVNVKTKKAFTFNIEATKDLEGIDLLDGEVAINAYWNAFVKMDPL